MQLEISEVGSGNSKSLSIHAQYGEGETGTRVQVKRKIPLGPEINLCLAKKIEKSRGERILLGMLAALVSWQELECGIESRTVLLT